MLSRNRLVRWSFVVSAAALVILSLPGSVAAQSPTPFSPNSPAAITMRNLMVVILWIAAAVFVVVEGLLIYSVWRYRVRPGEAGPLPKQIHGNTPIEIAWTTAPALVLVVVFVFTVRSMGAVASAPPTDLYVKVIGHQWWWEFQYPDLGIVTAGDLHVPVGKPVQFEITSGDVIHSFWSPELFGKTDAIPGRLNHSWVKVDRPGMFLGLCAEFCGTQHAQMRFRVIADSPEDFQTWVQNQQQPAAEPTTQLAQQGKQVFLSNACIGCHTIAGTPAQGKVGPDLTHFGSRTLIAAGALFNAPEDLTRWLRNPQEVKPGTLMPNLNLSETTIDQLVAYLESLK
ncbi:MAG: cytochrome c oxidase subunit II [Ardenticatenaceae bacterium]|nr:cytochrome c oxidase subunit II [Ardenticatenaceae bacterium]HBY96886.1 cytochrome c oxidase subunit II [Chloroflexota bacterium]